MKKYIVLLLCLAMLLAMAACGEQTPTTTAGTQNPSDPTSSSQQNPTEPTTPTEPTEPTKPNGGTVEPEDPNLSAYEKEFYQRFNAGQQVELFVEGVSIVLSIHDQTGKLLVKISRGGDEDELPTLEGDCEGDFQYEFHMFYESDIVDGENGTVTCRLQDNKMCLKRSGDFTDEIAQKYLEYMKTQELTQKQKEDLATILAGEPVEGYNILGEDTSLVFSAKVNDGNYTDIRVDCYDGEEIECYFLVLEDMVQQVMEWGNASRTIAYSLTGKRLYEEDRNGEECRRMDYIYNDAGQLLRIEGSENGEKIATEEYTYDTAGNILRKMRYQKGILTGKIEYNAKGDIITNVEYDEEGNPYWGVETILDADGKPVEKIQYHGGKEKDVIRYDANGRESSVTSYDYTGQISRTREYTYDEVGNKVQEYTCYADGSTCLETYNSNGDLIKMVNDEGDWRWEYTWDDRGNDLSYYRYYKDEPVEWTLNTYNEANLVTSTVYYGEDYSGEIGFKMKLLYFYNEKGLLVRQETFDYETSDTPDWVETYTYDADGNQLCNYRYNQDGSLWGWNEYTYNADGKPLTWIHYRGVGTSNVGRREIWKYDAQGNCIENLVYGMDGEIAMGFSNEYDENGKLVGKTEYTESICRVTRYVDETYSTCHVYDRESNQLTYWVETFWEDGYIVEEIYHYQE